MHLGESSWVIDLHTLSQVTTIFEHRCLGCFAVNFSPAGMESFPFNFFISLFPFAIEEVGGDDLYICLLSWQKIDEVLQMEEMEQVLWED